MTFQTVLKKVAVTLYADDTVLYYASKNVDDLKDVLNRDLSNHLSNDLSNGLNKIN